VASDAMQEYDVAGEEPPGALAARLTPCRGCQKKENKNALTDAMCWDLVVLEVPFAGMASLDLGIVHSQELRMGLAGQASWGCLPSYRFCHSAGRTTPGL
jgi:hypothetical protein